MVNKQNLWFLVLFSLVLVLSVYYVTMPDELFLTNNSYIDDTKEVVSVEESDLLIAMKTELTNEREEQVASIKKELNNNTKTIEEKNEAYEELLYLNELKGLEEAIETKIKNDFGLSSFVKINNNDVSVVVLKDKHDISLANDIMKSVQSFFKKDVRVIVKFEK